MNRMNKKRDRVDFAKFDKKPRRGRDEDSDGPRAERSERPSGDRPRFDGPRDAPRGDRPSFDRGERSGGRPASFASSHYSSRVKPRMEDSELNRVTVKKFNSDSRGDRYEGRGEGRSEGRRFERSERPSYGRDRPSGDRPRFDGPRDGPRDRSYSRPPFVKAENKFADSPKFSKPFQSEEKPRYEKRDAEKARFRSPSGERSEYREKKSFDAPREVDGESRLKGVFFFKNGLWTQNAVPGTVVYGERLFTMNGVEYRAWDPLRSKLAAGIKRGISQIGIKPGCTVLYLGCSTGTTVSHVAEIVGEAGKVYALDVAPRVMRDLVLLSKKRTNILPIMADANRPTTFSQLVSQVDVVFMDIAQQNQIEIFEKNVQAFLKPGGFGLLSYKSRSVDISKTPKQLYEEARAQLSQTMTIVDYKTLDPFEKDHAMYVCKK